MGPAQPGDRRAGRRAHGRAGARHGRLAHRRGAHGRLGRERSSRAAIAERSARQEASRQAKAEATARGEADQARAAAQAETYRAMLSEVKALRAGHQPGWRDEALANLARLAVMPTPRRDLFELRTEAAACMRTPDIHLVARLELPWTIAGSLSSRMARLSSPPATRRALNSGTCADFNTSPPSQARR